jgi:rRNA N6-adenosine-methyltransferase METTL5
MDFRSAERALRSVSGFKKPKAKLEQYLTPPDLAASTLAAILEDVGKLEDKTVVDLGCGTGMLSLASLLFGAPLCFSVDIDRDAIDVMRSNYERIEEDEDLGMLEVIQVDVGLLTAFLRVPIFDLAITNPPFGTKNNDGTDLSFLGVAIQVSEGGVYSFHKLSTQRFLTKKCGAKLIAMMNFELPQQYKFHTHESKMVEVGLFKSSKNINNETAD